MTKSYSVTFTQYYTYEVEVEVDEEDEDKDYSDEAIDLAYQEFERDQRYPCANTTYDDVDVVEH